MTKKEIIEELTKLGIEFDSNSKKNELEKLLPQDNSSEEPVAEEPVAEEPVAEEPKIIEHKIDGRKFGSKVAPLTIFEINDRELNGRKYKQITTLCGQTFLLSEKDLEDQLIKG